jgi:hypothetical protein
MLDISVTPVKRVTKYNARVIWSDEATCPETAQVSLAIRINALRLPKLSSNVLIHSFLRQRCTAKEIRSP